MYGRSTLPSGATRNSLGSLSSPTIVRRNTSPAPIVVLSSGGGRLILDFGRPAQAVERKATRIEKKRSFRVIPLMRSNADARARAEVLVSRGPLEIHQRNQRSPIYASKRFQSRKSPWMSVSVMLVEYRMVVLRPMESEKRYSPNRSSSTSVEVNGVWTSRRGLPETVGEWSAAPPAAGTKREPWPMDG